MYAAPRASCGSNAVLAQFAVRKELLGVAVGAISFFQMIGIAVSPTILGVAQNGAPDLEGGLKWVFIVSAFALATAMLLILTIPEISLDEEAKAENKLIKSNASVETLLS